MPVEACGQGSQPSLQTILVPKNSEECRFSIGNTMESSDVSLVAAIYGTTFAIRLMKSSSADLVTSPGRDALMEHSLLIDSLWYST